MLSQSSKLGESSTSVLRSAAEKAQATKPHKRSDSSENDDQNSKAVFKGRHSSSPRSGSHSRSNSTGKERKRSISQTVWVSAVPSISKYLRIRHNQLLAKKNANPTAKSQANSGRVPLGESPCSNTDWFHFGGKEGDMEMDVDRNGIQIPSLPSIAISTMVHMHHRARRDGGGDSRPAGDRCQWREIKQEEVEDENHSPKGDDAMEE